MREHAEHLEVVMLRLSGVETVLDGLIAIGGEDAPALMLVNGEVDRAFTEIQAVAEWMKEEAVA